MARAARSTRGKAACLGLLTVAWVGCANIQEPPGGPPDFDPPILVAATPDSGDVVDGFKDELEFQFDEVINERSGGGLENLIDLSPRSEEVRVSWKRTRITVKPKEGWLPAVVYHVTLLPGVADLRNNRLDSARTIIFSTGGPIPDTRLNGTVVDWAENSVARGALVEATLLPDSLTYQSQTDSSGNFELVAVPPGDYLLYVTIDGNNNRLRDARESFDSVVVRIDSTFEHVFWAFAHDSTGPQIRELTDPDSMTIRVAFTQMLRPGDATDVAVQVFAMPDTTPVTVAAVWNEETYDSVAAVETAIADSIRAALAAEADTLGADSLEVAAPDSAAADTTETALEVVQDSSTLAARDSLALETARIDSLLAQRPTLSALRFVRLESQLIPGARYLVVTTAPNVLGVFAESQTLLILAEPEPRDST